MTEGRIYWGSLANPSSKELISEEVAMKLIQKSLKDASAAYSYQIRNEPESERKLKQLPPECSEMDNTILHTIKLLQYYEDVRERLENVRDKTLRKMILEKPPAVFPELIQKKPIGHKNHGPTPFMQGRGTPAPTLTETNARLILKKCVATIFAHLGFVETTENVLTIMTDVSDKYFKKITHLMRVSADFGHLSGDVLFPDVMENVYKNLGIGSMMDIGTFYRKRILSYHKKTVRQCEKLTAEYAAVVSRIVKCKGVNGEAGGDADPASGDVNNGKNWPLEILKKEKQEADDIMMWKRALAALEDFTAEELGSDGDAIEIADETYQPTLRKRRRRRSSATVPTAAWESAGAIADSQTSRTATPAAWGSARALAASQASATAPAAAWGSARALAASQASTIVMPAAWGSAKALAASQASATAPAAAWGSAEALAASQASTIATPAAWGSAEALAASQASTIATPAAWGSAEALAASQASTIATPAAWGSAEALAASQASTIATPAAWGSAEALAASQASTIATPAAWGSAEALAASQASTIATSAAWGLATTLATSQVSDTAPTAAWGSAEALAASQASARAIAASLASAKTPSTALTPTTAPAATWRSARALTANQTSAARSSTRGKVSTRASTRASTLGQADASTAVHQGHKRNRTGEAELYATKPGKKFECED